MKNKEHIIKGIEEGSIAEELGIEPGDVLVSINDKTAEDVLDYHFLIHDEELVVVIRKPDGEEWEFEIEKDYDEDLGLVFGEGLMDDYKSCRNKCVFCFIDQLPKGMRDTLYFKDDDARLSFLQGNYITLTNMSDKDIERICRYKLSPVNISVHTTNPELRCKMLNNRFAGNLIDRIKMLANAGIIMNTQIVLCKGYNDKAELDRTIGDLAELIPVIDSLSVVPVGLTDYREGLAKLEMFNSEEAKELIEQVKGWQEKLLESHGTRFVYASDEWYINAGMPIPMEEEYEGYPQIENGVGIVRSLEEEFKEYLEELSGDNTKREVSIATGVLAAPILTELMKKLKEKYPQTEVKVFEIKNDFFGHNITVAGLLTGRDILNQLKEKKLGSALILSDVMIRNGEDVFLDDMHIFELEKALQTEIRIVQSNGQSLIDTIIQ